MTAFPCLRPSACAPLALLARAAWAVCAGWAALPAAAQNAGALRITPTLDSTLTAVHSTRLNVPDNQTILQIRPGVQLQASGGRVRGRLDYGLSAFYRSPSVAGQGQIDNFQNRLNAVLDAEVVERWAFVDATATITQQALSAYGQQSVDGTQINSNRSEVSQVSIRPRAQGVVAGAVSYQVGLSADATHAAGAATPDSNNLGLSVTLGQARGGGVLGWSALGTQQRVTFGSRSTESGRLALSLLIRPDFGWSGSLRGGHETTSVTSVYRQSHDNWGGELRWTPSPRTTALVSADRRYFGRAYQVQLEHRFANSSLRFTSIQDANNTANGAGVGQPITIYQALYNQFASVQPDPTLRDLLVRSTLLSLRLDGNAVVPGGFVNGGSSLQRRDDLALTYTARRSAFTLQAFSSDTRRIDTLSAGVDATPVRQEGLNAVISYRLTPTSNVNLGASGLRTHSTATQPGNRLKSATLSWSDQITPFVNVGASARHSAFDAQVNPYRESALSATLNLRF